MKDKEKADCLIELHKAQLDRFMQTREIEFRVNLALWSLIALSGSFLYGKIHLASTSARLLYAAFAICLFAGHMMLWMVPIQRSEDTDDHYINEYRKAVESMVGVVLPRPDKAMRHRLPWSMAKRGMASGSAWILAETGITLALLTLVGVMLSAS